VVNPDDWSDQNTISLRERLQPVLDEYLKPN
jgi:hypothetical protein